MGGIAEGSAKLILILGATLIFSAAASAADCPVGQRSFAHAGGEDCIPEQPQRIVAVRHDSVATPLLDIGAPVVGVGIGIMDDGTEYVRGASDIFGQEFIDAANLVSVGNANEPDLEAIAGLEPDLIILTTFQNQFIDQAKLIAPTVVIPPNLPFFDHLKFLADAAGMSGVYEQRRSVYEAKIERTKALIGDPSAITVSRLDMAEDGLWFYPNWGAVDQVLNDLGFSRPAVQAEAKENLTALSFEEIRAFDGDIVLSSRAVRFGQTVTMLEDQWDGVAPFWRDLPGVQSGNHYWYDRDIWVGYTFKSLDVVTDSLLLLSAGRFGDE